MNGNRENPNEEQLAFLGSHGFTHLGGWDFSRGLIVFDLSAADLLQCERIFHEKLFVKLDFTKNYEEYNS